MKRKIRQFAVIFSHPELPDSGHLCYVEATTPRNAQDTINDEVTCEDSIWFEYDYTIWPTPIS